MTNDTNFLTGIVVDKKTADKINNSARLLAKRSFYLEHYKSLFLEHLRDEYNQLRMNFPNVEIIPEARIKGQQSYSDKVDKVLGESPSKDIYDIFGNRYIIVSVNGSKSEKDIIPILYQIRDFLAYSFSDKHVIPSRIKDYVEHPKHSTYQSLHITRTHDVPDTNRSFQSETQLRSYFMHSNAHSGFASHANSYKERIPGVTPLPNSLEYVFDENGFCIEVKEKPFERAFEDFFGIPYDPKYSLSHREK